MYVSLTFDNKLQIIFDSKVVYFTDMSRINFYLYSNCPTTLSYSVFQKRTAAPVNITRAHAFTYIRKLQFGKRPLLNSNLREFAVKLRPDIILNHRLSSVYRSRALHFEYTREQCNKLNSCYTCISFTFIAFPRVKLTLLFLTFSNYRLNLC